MVKSATRGPDAQVQKPKPVKVAGYPLSSLQQLMDIKDSDNFYFKDTKKGANILNELIDFQD